MSARPPAGEADARAVRVRSATVDDLPAVERIERASFGDPWSLRSFADSLARDFVRMNVLEQDGEIAGYSVVWHSGDECELANLAVDPARRGSGHGARLLDALLAQASAEGAMVMFLEVRDSNAVARALYASRGFHEVGRRTKYYRNPVEDALVLRRDLEGDGAAG